MLDTIKKNKYEFSAVLIALAALIYRLIYINLNKGLWWDSASFIIITQRILGKTSCLFEAHRLPGFPILLAPVYLIFGLNPIVFRIFEILFAAGSVLAVYFLAAKMFKNKNLGIIAAIFLSLSWLNFFYSLRVLSRVPAAFLLLVGIYLFWVGYNDKNWKKMFFSGLVFSFYFLIRFELLFVLGAIGIFVFIDFIRTKDKKSFIKRKDLWAFAGGLLIFVIPYMIWQMFAFGSPIYQLTFNYETAKHFNESYSDQFSLMPHILSTGWMIFFVIGLLFTVVNIKKRNYLFLLLLMSLFFVGLMISPHHEDRYALPILPIMGIFASIGVMSIVNIVIKKNKIRIVLYIGIALLLGLASMHYGMPIIEGKGPSYSSVETMGKILNQLPNDVVYAPYSVNAPIPQLCVWADKEYKPFPDTEKEFLGGFDEGDLAYCSLGYDSCPDYLFPRISNDAELNEVVKKMESNGLAITSLNQDGAGGASMLIQRVNQTTPLNESVQE